MSTVEKKTCQCENCGNEAEMVITCTLPDQDEAGSQTDEQKSDAKPRKKQQITCKHCGNEAEMWIDS